MSSEKEFKEAEKKLLEDMRQDMIKFFSQTSMRYPGTINKDSMRTMFLGMIFVAEVWGNNPKLDPKYITHIAAGMVRGLDNSEPGAFDEIFDAITKLATLAKSLGGEEDEQAH